jgi:Core-2/I-Branching enzyme
MQGQRKTLTAITRAVTGLNSLVVVILTAIFTRRNQPTIAALVLAHHSPSLLSRLVKRLNSYGARCFIHIDAQVDITPFQAECALTSAIFVEPRIEVKWGGFSLVAATISLLSAALSEPSFSHFLLISGDSYPIKPRKQFRQMVIRPYEQIELAVISPQNPMYTRIAQTFLPDTELGAFRDGGGDSTLQRFLTKGTLAQFNRIRRVFKMKQAGFDWRYARGSQWWVLTRAAAEKCIDVIKNETQLLEWFTYSSVPDEALFHTILENFGSFKIDPRAPVCTVWDRSPRPYLFKNSADLEMLKKVSAPLARKFSLEGSSLLLDLLDEWMDTAR